MDFRDILSELEIATEGVNSSARGEYKSLQRTVSNATKEAKNAMKNGRYPEAIKHCDEAISALNVFKTKLQESGAETNGIVAGNALVAAKAMAGTVLATLAALGAAKVGGKVLNNRKATNEAFAAYEAWLIDEFGEDALEALKKADRKTRDAANKQHYNIMTGLKGSSRITDQLEKELKKAKKSGDPARIKEAETRLKEHKAGVKQQLKEADYQKGIATGKLKVNDAGTVMVPKEMKRAEKETRERVDDKKNMEVKVNRDTKAKEEKAATQEVKREVKQRNAKMSDYYNLWDVKDDLHGKKDVTKRTEKGPILKEKPKEEKPVAEPKQKPVSGDSVAMVKSSPKPSSKPVSKEAPKSLLGGKNIGIAAVGAGTVAALVSFMKNMKSGKNMNIVQINKGIDLAIKSLEGIKADCKDAMRASESDIDIFDYDIEDENLPVVEAFYVGVFDEIFTHESALESLINAGFDDDEAYEIFMECFVE